MGQTREQRRVKEKQRRENATAAVGKYLLSIGAIETPKAWNRYSLQTKAGDLGITPMDGKWIACQFDDVKRALKVVPNASQDHLNQYSGKWNFFNFDTAEMDGLKALEAFKREIAAILP